MNHYKVVAAIIIDNNKILCTQRDVGKFEYISKKYEFPGGKIESGETKEEALEREIKEELNIVVSVKEEYLTVHHKYPDFELTMYSFICSTKNTSLTLIDHVDYKWLCKHELSNLDWAEADIPIVNKLMESN